MSARVSPLLATIESAIADERHPVARDRWRARLAAEWARRGRVGEARALVAELRTAHDRVGDARIVPMLNFADACIERAAGHGDAALARMRRAHALARAHGQAPLAALAAAWLAHTLWNREDLQSAVAFVGEAIAGAGTAIDIDGHAALCRACFVIGEILLVSRQGDAASPWFVRGRFHAKAIGDDAAFVALAQNLATLHVMLLRQSTLAGSAGESEARAATLHAETAASASRLFGIDEPVAPLIRAQLLSLCGRPEQAIVQYRAHGEAYAGVAAARARAEWLADEAWCLARIGSKQEALATAAAAEAAVVAGVQTDDRAALHGWLARVHEACGDCAAAARHADRSAVAWADYARWQALCAERCLALPLPPLPGPRHAQPVAAAGAD